MKRSGLILAKQNYLAAKGKCDEDRFIRSNESVSSRIIYRENSKWQKYVKSKPKIERDRLDRRRIQQRARRYEKYEKDKNHENLAVDLDAIEEEITLTNELPNLVVEWTVKSEPKVWNNTGTAYNLKWTAKTMTILDPNKNVITVEDAMPGVKEGKPMTRDNGVVPYYAVVPFEDILPYSCSNS